jgi:hypothetical protein
MLNPVIKKQRTTRSAYTRASNMLRGPESCNTAASQRSYCSFPSPSYSYSHSDSRLPNFPQVQQGQASRARRALARTRGSCQPKIQGPRNRLLYTTRKRALLNALPLSGCASVSKAAGVQKGPCTQRLTTSSPRRYPMATSFRDAARSTRSWKVGASLGPA